MLFVGARDTSKDHVFVLRAFETTDPKATELYVDLVGVYGKEPQVDLLFGTYPSPEAFFRNEPTWQAHFKGDPSFPGGVGV